MACKYKYNNNWYSKEELQSILYKERGIDKYGKLVKPEISKKVDNKVEYIFGNDALKEQETKEEDSPYIPEITALDNPKIDDKGQYLLFNLDENQVNYTLKAIDILQSDKAKQVFAKGEKNKWTLDKILSELNIPKEQKILILDLGISDREQIALELASNYSYTVEINTAKNTKDNIFDDYHTQEDYDNLDEETKLKFSEGTNTQHYSYLTVPGGTNGSYREQNFETPLIKVPKSHAQFNTESTIGFNRNDDRQVYTEKDIDSLLEIMKKSGILKVKC